MPLAVTNGNGYNPPKKIKTIFIANVLEGFYHGYQGLGPEARAYWTLYDTVEGNRVLFYNGDNKVVITSASILPGHFEHICQLMNWSNVHNLSPRFPSYSISEDMASQEKFRRKIEAIIMANPGVGLVPYRATPEFNALVESLKRKKLPFTTPETMSPEQEFVTMYAHCKRGFRHLWDKAFPTGSSLSIQLPQGFITGNKDEAIEAAWWFRRQKRSFVIKYNRGSQGIGIMMNYYSKLPDTKNAFVREIKEQLVDKIWEEATIVVEELVDIDKTQLGGSPSVEFFIDQTGRVHPTYAGEQVIAEDHKTFLGFYIHPGVMKNKHIENAFRAGALFGKELSRLGYRGTYDVDLVITKGHKLYAVESNMRRTGGTHIHEAAVSLLGKGYGDKYHVLGEDISLPQGSRLSYKQAMEMFKDIIYRTDKKTGMLIQNPDMLQVNILNVIFFAEDARTIQRLRKLVRRRTKAVNHL